MVLEDIVGLIVLCALILVLVTLFVYVTIYELKNTERRAAKREKACDYFISLVESMSVNGHPVITVDKENKK